MCRGVLSWRFQTALMPHAELSQIVGAYYRSPAAAGFQLCTRCNAAAGGGGGLAHGRRGGARSAAAASDGGGGPLVCVPHRAPALPPPWEEAGSDDGRGGPDADDFELRLSQLQVSRAGMPLARWLLKADCL